MPRRPPPLIPSLEEQQEAIRRAAEFGMVPIVWTISEEEHQQLFAPDPQTTYAATTEELRRILTRLKRCGADPDVILQLSEAPNIAFHRVLTTRAQREHAAWRRIQRRLRSIRALVGNDELLSAECRTRVLAEVAVREIQIRARMTQRSMTALARFNRRSGIRSVGVGLAISQPIWTDVARRLTDYLASYCRPQRRQGGMRAGRLAKYPQEALELTTRILRIRHGLEGNPRYWRARISRPPRA